jgi:hypothetical protein
MDQGGSGPVVKIISLKVRGERLANQSLNKISGNIIAAEERLVL